MYVTVLLLTFSAFAIEHIYNSSNDDDGDEACDPVKNQNSLFATMPPSGGVIEVDHVVVNPVANVEVNRLKYNQNALPQTNSHREYT